MRKRAFTCTILLVAAAMCVPLSADVTWEEESNMSGMMKMFHHGQKTVTRVSGDKMRVDSDGEIQIIDLAAETITTLDTKKKTYSVMTFEEMRRRMQEALQKADESMKTGEGEGSDVNVSAKTDIKVTETDNQKTVGGFPCQQYLMETSVDVQSEKDDQQANLSTLTELWLTKSAPGTAEINTFHRKMAEKLGTAAIGRQLLSGSDAQSNAFATNMQEMASEMRKLDGFPMRTVFYFGSPEAARKEALEGGGEEKEEGKGGGLGGFLNKMRSGGVSGEGGVMMKMTNEVKQIETQAVDPALFGVPDNYKQVEVK